MALETVRRNAMPRLATEPAILLATKRFSLPAVDWPLRPAVAMLLLAAIVIGWPWLSGRVTIPWDAKAHFQPQIQFLAQSLARGESPFWAPYVFSGQPQIADPQSMIFSPPFLLLALLNSAPEPVGRRCDPAGHGVPRRRRADAVVPRPGLALGRRADRGAGLRLRRRRWPGASSTSARC